MTQLMVGHIYVSKAWPARDDISNKGCTFKSSPPPFAKLRKSLNQEKLVWLYQNVVMSKPSKSVNT